MPRTTSAISERDLEVLDFVARFGLVASSAVGTWARTAQAVTYARQRRWVERGLVQLIEPINGSGRLLVCTREGLRAVGRDGLGPGRVSVGRRPHAIVVAHVGATLERDGHVVLSERELAAVEVREHRRLYSAELNDGRFHRPDLVLPSDDLAIEVELSQKGSWRLDSILRAWRGTVGAGKFRGVRYLCGDRALRPLNKAVERTATEGLIEVTPLLELNGNGRD